MPRKELPYQKAEEYADDADMAANGVPTDKIMFRRKFKTKDFALCA